MHNPSKRPPTQSDLAADLGVSLRTLQNWRKEGVDLRDLDALRTRAAAAKSKLESCENYQQARLRKVSAQATREEIAAKKEAGELVLASGIHAEGEAAGRAFQSSLNRLEGDLPGRLAGRTAGEIKKILCASFRELLQELADRPAEKYLKLP